MRTLLLSSSLALVTVVAGFSPVRAQTKPPSSGAKTPAKASVPDLSGDWGFNDSHPSGQSFSVSDPNGRKTGTPEDDTPYRPWMLAKLKSERPESGPNATFDNPTDPRLKYCDPIGYPRIYLVPTQFKFIQTRDIVYILYGYGPTWRTIPLNKPHREDPDPSWWGDSIGRYEGDTLVIDTIGFNDKTWLDHVGRSHSDALHLVERFRRVDRETLQLDITFEDPKAYTKPWAGRKVFALGHSGFADAYSCSMSEYEHFRQSVIDPVVESPSKK
jgi:hypothetical protein